MKAWPWDKERTRNGASYLGYEVEEREIPYGIQLVVHDKGSGKACNVNFYNSGKRLPQGDPALLKKLEEELVKLDQQAKITIDLLPYGVTILNSEPTSADLIAAIRECFTRLERLSREKSGVDIKEKPGAQVLETVAQKENLCIENVAPEVTKGFRNHFGKLLSTFYSCFRNPIQHAHTAEMERWLTKEELKLLLAAVVLLEALFKKYVVGSECNE